MTRHITHVVGTLNAGGVQKLVIGLAQAPALRDYRHSVLCVLGAEGELRADFIAAGIEILSCPIAWPTRIPGLPSYRATRWLRQRLASTFEFRLAALLRLKAVDLVHTHLSTRPGAQAAATLRFGRRPLVWTVHGLYDPKREAGEWQRAAALTRVGAVITADSGPVADHLVEHHVVARERIRVVHAGADTARFARHSSRVPGWRALLGIPDQAVVVGTSGRLVDAKAHDVLIAAMTHTPTEMHLVIAGAGPLEPILRAQIERANLGDRVHMVGFQDDVPALLRELDAFVLSSRSEGFPLALIEALAAGLPAIATAVGGVREMLGDDGGIVVEPEDPVQLGAAMTTYLDAEIRARYARRGPDIAHAFSFDRCAEEFAKIYRELLPL